jgi:Methyltransferase domain
MTATRLMRGLLRRFPIGKEFLDAYDLMRVSRDCPAAHHPGEYQSPIPSLSRIKAQRERIFNIPKEIPGVDLNIAGQRALGMKIAPLVADCPFPQTKTPPWRYFGANNWFSWGDAVVLHALLRHNRPARVVEVGSGYSSAVILDTVEHYLSGSCHCTFVEPHPERLQSLLRPDDQERCRVIVEPVETLSLDPFRELSTGDILLIDSSHVSKVGSDVNWLFFEVLPRLGPGVFVHVHDVKFPFEYPENWFEKGFAPNEAYILRSFLMFNYQFQIAFWNDCLRECEGQWLAQNLPGCLKGWNTSIWLRTTGEAPCLNSHAGKA